MMGGRKATPPAGAGDSSASGETSDPDEPPVEEFSADSAEQEVVPPPKIGEDPLESPPAMGGHARRALANTGESLRDADHPASPSGGTRTTGTPKGTEVNSQAPPSAAARMVGILEAAARTAGVALRASPSPGGALFAIMTARAAIQAEAGEAAGTVDTPSAFDVHAPPAAGTMGAGGGLLNAAPLEQAAVAAGTVDTVPSHEPLVAAGSPETAGVDTRIHPSIVGPATSASMVAAAAAAGRTFSTSRARAAFAEAAGMHTIHPSTEPPRDAALEMLQRNPRDGTRVTPDLDRPNVALSIQAPAGAGVAGVGAPRAGQGAAMAAAAEAAAALAAESVARAAAGAVGTATAGVPPRRSERSVGIPWSGDAGAGLPGVEPPGAGVLGAGVPVFGPPWVGEVAETATRGVSSWQADEALMARSRLYVDTWLSSHPAVPSPKAGETGAGGAAEQVRGTRKRKAVAYEEGVGNWCDDGASRRKRRTPMANGGSSVSKPRVAGPTGKKGKGAIGRASAEDGGKASIGKKASCRNKTEVEVTATVANTACRDDTFKKRGRDEDDEGDEDDESEGGAGSRGGAGGAGGGEGWRTAKRIRPSAPAPGGNS